MAENSYIQSLFSLEDRVALVTGGSSGLGRRMAFAMARAGAAVVLAARRADALMDAKAEIEDAGGRAATLEADLLAGDDAIAACAEAAAEPFGAPDILVNAAGINLREPPEKVTPESWDRTLRINLTVPFFLARALVPGMKAKGGGAIINIASLQSFRAMANGIAYGSSKGGVAQLTRAMAQAWSGDGITANALVPGMFPTELTGPLFADAATRDRLAAATAIGRNGELPDIDGATIFLASRAGSYITGVLLPVDGGFLAK
ncbi:MAG: SDR family oxidoreductase [Pseudomonadota bacterium]|nr:SDR family oxidoreductase [Pseudomonadota bacterium]